MYFANYNFYIEILERLIVHCALFQFIWWLINYFKRGIFRNCIDWIKWILLSTGNKAIVSLTTYIFYGNFSTKSIHLLCQNDLSFGCGYRFPNSNKNFRLCLGEHCFRGRCHNGTIFICLGKESRKKESFNMIYRNIEKKTVLGNQSRIYW